MAIFLYSDNELIPYTLGDILSDPIRAEFLVSDTETIFDETLIEMPNGDIEEFNLPFVNTINNKHYYSLPHNRFVSLDVGISGPDDEFKVMDLLTHDEILSVNNPENFSIYFATDTNGLYVFDGTKWQIYNLN